MRTSKFTEEQIAMALRQHDAGTTVGAIRPKLEISDTTFLRWQKRHAGMGVTELRELRQPRREQAAEGARRRLVARHPDPAGGAPANVVTPAQRPWALRRDAGAWARHAYCVSEQRACRIVGATRSNVRNRSRRPLQPALRTRLEERATTHVR